MGRRSTPERLDEARRAGVRNRLIGEGIPEDVVDIWLDAWVGEAEDRGVDHGSDYWRGEPDKKSVELVARGRVDVVGQLALVLIAGRGRA